MTSSSVGMWQMLPVPAGVRVLVRLYDDPEEPPECLVFSVFAIRCRDEGPFVRTQVLENYGGWRELGTTYSGDEILAVTTLHEGDDMRVPLAEVVMTGEVTL